ncbi:MAG: DMT family transporter [Clostridiales bacterium]|jgi:drug/metabolite transporter (DMT)-like permease|nr:DMT family transporter [Clostridiales bacterium]
MEYKRKISLMLLALTAVMWSVGGLLIKLVNVHPFFIAGTRSLIAAVIITIYVRKPRFTWSFPQIAAAAAYALTVTAFVLANKYTTAANAILIQYTAPIYVALFSGWLLKEKVTRLDWITIAVVFCGMILFFLDDLDTRGLAGNIFALISGVGFGFFPIFMRMQKNGSPIESVILGNLTAALAGIPFIFAAAPTAMEWFYLVILGVFQLGISYILFSHAIKHTAALEATLITMIEPILNPIWVLIFLGEKPGAHAIIGGIIVISAITLRSVITSSARKN